MTRRIRLTRLGFDGASVYLNTADDITLERFNEWVRQVTGPPPEGARPWTPDELRAWCDGTGVL